MGVETNDQGLVIHGPFRRQKVIPWRQISGFEAAPAGSWSNGQVLGVRTTDGALRCQRVIAAYSADALAPLLDRLSRDLQSANPF
jgi:hypothetical protein